MNLAASMRRMNGGCRWHGEQQPRPDLPQALCFRITPLLLSQSFAVSSSRASSQPCPLQYFCYKQRSDRTRQAQRAEWVTGIYCVYGCSVAESHACDQVWKMSRSAARTATHFQLTYCTLCALSLYSCILIFSLDSYTFPPHSSSDPCSWHVKLPFVGQVFFG